MYALKDRRLDLLAFAVILAFLVATCFTLRVYYRITVYEVDVVRIDPDGARVELPTPESIDELILWHLPPRSVLTHLETSIDRLQREGAWSADLARGSRFEWTVRYSFNSLALDQSQVFSYPEAAPARR